MGERRTENTPGVRPEPRPDPPGRLTMPRETSTASIAESDFRAIGTSCRVLVTEPTVLDAATAMARDHLAELDAAASRFRPDSEVSRLAALAVAGPASRLVSFLLADYLRAALEMADLTDGLVDPSVGAAVIASGYDADIDEIRASAASRGGEPVPVPGWRSIRISEANVVSVPQGMVIDLGATAKAHAADTIARRLAARFRGGFLVNLGGDIAISGDVPEDGWNIGVELADGREAQVIRSDGSAVCTSSTRLRTWTSGGRTRHHIIDPRTGTSADAVWASVTCAAPSAIVANAMSTAAIVLGADAPAWLEAKGVTARLDGADGTLTLVNGWPHPEEKAA